MIRVVLKVQYNWRLDTSICQSRSCLDRIWSTIGAVEVLQDLGGAGEAIGNVGVQRQVGAAVNLC